MTMRLFLRLMMPLSVLFVVVVAVVLPVTRGFRTLTPADVEFGPETTVITGPLDAAGYPDYVAAINERMSDGVSREENFWVLMWPAIGNAERSRAEYIRTVERTLGVSIDPAPRIGDPLTLAGMKWNTPEGDQLQAQWDLAMERPWSRDEFPDIAAWVDVHAHVLDEVHAACLRPKAYAPAIAGADEPFQLIAMLLPHVQALRGAARLLSARAMLRLGEGDVDGAWKDLLDIHRLARHSERGWTLIEALVGYALRGIALQPTAHWFGHCGLGREELLTRWAELRPLLEPTPLGRAIDSERLMFADTTIALLSGRASSEELDQLLGRNHHDGKEWFNLERHARERMLRGGNVSETLRYGNQKYDELIAALEPATHRERAAALKAVEKRIAAERMMPSDTASLVRAALFPGGPTTTGRILVGVLTPSLSHIEVAYTRTEAYVVLLQGTVQACLYREREGTLPIRWSELESEQFGDDLLDRFTGDPVKFRRDEAGVTLYSVGPNGNDDGGRIKGEGLGADDVRVLVPVRE